MKKIYVIPVVAVLLLLCGCYFVNKRAEKCMHYQTDAMNAFGFTVVLDAGHGGEDGGAVAPDGTTEKTLNLQISGGIADYFELFGIPYVQVRTEDVSVCDPGLKTVRERKRSDIMNRYSLINSTQNAILLSIHQNMYTQAKYNGMQVFYAEDIPSSKKLAEQIQKAVCTAMQPENKRTVKPSTDSIYLLYRAKTTSVMVECGFLSNEKELAQLKSSDYQAKIGYFILKGLLNYCRTKGAENGSES